MNEKINQLINILNGVKDSVTSISDIDSVIMDNGFDSGLQWGGSHDGNQVTNTTIVVYLSDDEEDDVFIGVEDNVLYLCDSDHEIWKVEVPNFIGESE